MGILVSKDPELVRQPQGIAFGRGRNEYASVFDNGYVGFGCRDLGDKDCQMSSSIS
jgi:hypothetical protein